MLRSDFQVRFHGFHLERKSGQALLKRVMQLAGDAASFLQSGGMPRLLFDHGSLAIDLTSQRPHPSCRGQKHCQGNRQRAPKSLGRPPWRRLYEV